MSASKCVTQVNALDGFLSLPPFNSILDQVINDSVVPGSASSSRACRTAPVSAGPAFTKCDLPFDQVAGWECLPNDTREKLEAHTPLFLYLMLEGTATGGRHLGPVGSAILLEVFGTMLKRCSTSFLNYKEDGKPKKWCPDPCIWNPKGLDDVDPKNARLSQNEGDPCVTPSETPKGFTLADIARYVG